MQNREYQRRATRQGIRSFCAQEFYRPEVRPIPVHDRRRGSGKRSRRNEVDPRQMKLDFSQVITSLNRPLNDLFPEAYE